MKYEAIDITVENFKNYGFYIDENSKEALAENENFTYWDGLAEFEIGPVASAGIVIGHPNNYIVEAIERHCDTPEILVGLNGDSIVLLGLSDNNSTKISNMQAFRIKEGETVVLNPGVWHSPPVPVEDNCRILVLFNTKTPEKDLEKLELDNTFLGPNI